MAPAESQPGQPRELTGLWAVQAPDDCCRLFRWRQVDGCRFEGLEIGVGSISDGSSLPGEAGSRLVSWCSNGLRWRGCLDPTGWCIRDGSYSDAATGASKGSFAALRQREGSPEAMEDELNQEAASGDRMGLEFQDWANGLFFSLDREGREQLLDADGAQVMMEWEKPYMERCAEELEVTNSSDVLEIGFGCGYSASAIQSAGPRSHTIIECSQIVLERLKTWASDKPNVRIIEGTWQRRLPELGTFDCIFFDDYGEPGRSDTEMFVNCPDARYKEFYRNADSHFEAFVKIAMRWHARAEGRISGYLVHPIKMQLEDVEVSYEPYGVEPPSHCNYFFNNTAMVPLYVKQNDKRSHSPHSESTKSRSRSRSRSFTRTISSGSNNEAALVPDAETRALA